MNREKNKDPVKYSFQVHKRNAKRRKIPHELTLEEFREFCVETEYMSKKGIYKTSLHIDRIDESKGYTRDNIQTLENSENIKKSLKFRYNGQKMEFTVETEKRKEYDDLPF